MKNKDQESRLLPVLSGLLLALGVQSAHADQHNGRLHCDENSPLCTEVLHSLNYEGKYTGHDEPSLLFYSNVPGSGNSNVYELTLPKDPPITPRQDGTGGTFNFQLHPAFWFGMARCVIPNPHQTPVNHVRLIVIPISSMALDQRSRTTSASIPGQPSWKCSSTRPLG